MPKNNSDISRDIERIRHEEALTKEIKRLRDELYKADKKVVGLLVDNDALVKINRQLQDDLEMLRSDNLQLIEQIGGGE